MQMNTWTAKADDGSTHYYELCPNCGGETLATRCRVCKGERRVDKGLVLPLTVEDLKQWKALDRLAEESKRVDLLRQQEINRWRLILLCVILVAGGVFAIVEKSWLATDFTTVAVFALLYIARAGWEHLGKRSQQRHREEMDEMQEIKRDLLKRYDVVLEECVPSIQYLPDGAGPSLVISPISTPKI